MTEQFFFLSACKPPHTHLASRSRVSDRWMLIKQAYPSASKAGWYFTMQTQQLEDCHALEWPEKQLTDKGQEGMPKAAELQKLPSNQCLMAGVGSEL